MPLCSLMDDEKLVDELLLTVGELECLNRGHEAEEKRYVLVVTSQKQLRGEVLRRLAAKAWRRLWLLEPAKGLPRSDAVTMQLMVS